MKDSIVKKGSANTLDLDFIFDINITYILVLSSSWPHLIIYTFPCHHFNCCLRQIVVNIQPLHQPRTPLISSRIDHNTSNTLKSNHHGRRITLILREEWKPPSVWVASGAHSEVCYVFLHGSGDSRLYSKSIIQSRGVSIEESVSDVFTVKSGCLGCQWCS